MHTIEEIGSESFEYRVDGDVVSRETVMPRFTSDDRLGVAMGTGAEGVGAGNFILSAVVAFYGYLSETRDEDFFEYPDFYTFQTTGNPADYRMLDIYPDHKNVAVEPETEPLLEAINDRAITTLLVPDVIPDPPDVDDITRRSAQRRIEDCYVYAPDGRPREAEFSIGLPREPVAGWYATTLESTADASIDSLPAFGSDDEWLSQQFRRVSLEEALARLPVG